MILNVHANKTIWGKRNLVLSQLQNSEVVYEVEVVKHVCGVDHLYQGTSQVEHLKHNWPPV